MSRAGHDDRGQVSPWLVVGLVVLGVGGIVAVVGVWNAVTAVQDRVAIADYVDARVEARDSLDAGQEAAALGQQLCDCDIQARDLANQQIDALRASDVDTYNSLVDELNALAQQWNDLLTQLEPYVPDGGDVAVQTGA